MFVSGKINYLLFVARSPIHGKGTYTSEKIPARRKIGSISGEIITKTEARKKARETNSIALVELWNGAALDASKRSNALRYVNHSCNPNTFMRTLNFHVEFYALRMISPREELTCNYGPTHHEGRKQCRCGTINCKGYL
jgi:uncharacterized protein